MKEIRKTFLQIIEDRQSIVDVLELLDGELTPEIVEAMHINQEEVLSKVETFLVLLHQLDAHIYSNQKLIDRCREGIAGAERASERLKESLLIAVNTFGRIHSGPFTLSSRKSTSVEITDQELLPSEFLRTKISLEPDKKRSETR